MPAFAPDVLAMPRSGIREIMDLAAGRDDVVHLEVGQPDFRTPDHVVEAAIAAARDGFHGYTPNKGLRTLREAVAATCGVPTEPDAIVVTCGAVNALYAALVSIVEPGDAVLVPEPGWPNYGMMATLLQAREVAYPVDLRGDGEPDLDRLDAVLASTDRAKALLLNTPNNPTGAVYRPDTVAAIAERCARHDVFLVADECYGRIVFDGEHVSPAALDTGATVLTVSSVSKAFAMTGWRVGFLVARDVATADVVAKVQEPVVACASAVAQKAAEAALLGDQQPVTDMVAAYARRAEVAHAALRRHGLALAPTRGAFYAMADISAATSDSYAFARRAVAEHGVAVAPGETFGPAGAGTVRISLATDEPAIVAGIDRLAGAVAAWTEGEA